MFLVIVLTFRDSSCQILTFIFIDCAFAVILPLILAFSILAYNNTNGMLAHGLEVLASLVPFHSRSLLASLGLLFLNTAMFVGLLH